MSGETVGKSRAVPVLKRLELFRGLLEPDYEALVTVCSSVFYRPGQVLFEQGDPGTSLLVILSGEVEITNNSRGLIKKLRSGEILGEMSLVRSAPRTATATAAQPSMLLELKTRELLRLLERHPRIGHLTMRNIAVKLADRLEAESRRR